MALICNKTNASSYKWVKSNKVIFMVTMHYNQLKSHLTFSDIHNVLEIIDGIGGMHGKSS